MSTRGRVVLQGIGKSFGEVEVLHDINLAIEPGEFFSLLGPSGSGKTTTLRIIAGLETPHAGVVHIDDRDVTHVSPGDRDAAMVFQSYALYPHMTVRGNIAFPLRMIGTPRAEIERQVSPPAGSRSSTCWTASPASSAVASSSVAPSHGPSCARPACSFSTSHCPISMQGYGCRRGRS